MVATRATRPSGRRGTTPVQARSRRAGRHQQQRRRQQPAGRQSRRPTRADETTELAKKFYDDTLRRGVHGLAAEFRELRAYTPALATSNAFGQHREKNRYRDVLCLDISRVQLRYPPCGGDGYVHASYVRGCRRDHQYICTQAPMDNTIADFWAMVWEQRSQLVVMLCRTMEANQRKCSDYWPTKVGEGGAMTVGPFRIVKAQQSQREFLDEPLHVLTVNRLTVTRMLPSASSATSPSSPSPRSISRRRGEETRSVLQAIWETWPDKGVPSTRRAIIKLRHKILAYDRVATEGNDKKKKEQAPAAPVIIHCSAGIGRTGTVVLLDNCMGHLESGRTELIVAEETRRLRNQRIHSVQTDQQYIYVHAALLDYIAEKWLKEKGKAAGDERRTQFMKDFESYIKNGVLPPRR